MVLLASMQRVYELMLVLRPDFGLEEKQARDLVEKLIGDRKIQELTVMGKKRLAYPIKKQTEGVYVVATVAGEVMNVGVLEKQIKLGTDVLRFLLTVKEPASPADK
jgi:small subunit ribosomal protein S6